MIPVPEQHQAPAEVQQQSGQAQQEAQQASSGDWGWVADAAELALEVTLTVAGHTGEAAYAVGSAAVEGACAVGSAAADAVSSVADCIGG